MVTRLGGVHLASRPNAALLRCGAVFILFSNLCVFVITFEMHHMFYILNKKERENSVDGTQVEVKVCDCGIRHLVIQDTFRPLGDVGSALHLNGRL